MITINVRRLDADTNNTISTYVVVGKYGTSKYDLNSTDTFTAFKLPYVTTPNGNLYAIEISNPRGYSFYSISGNVTFTRGGSIWYTFPVPYDGFTVNIQLRFKSTTPYYKVGVSSNISSGSGIFGAYGETTYDTSWSGASPTFKNIPAGKRIAIEVNNVPNYELSSVSDCSPGGTTSSGRLYFLSIFTLSANTNFFVTYRSLLHTLSVRKDDGGSTRCVHNGTTYVDERDISVKEGDSVTLKAIPNTANHYKFKYWLKNSVLYTYNAEFTYQMDSSDVTFKAVFEQYPSHSVSVKPKPPLTNYGGTITINGVETFSATFYEDTGISLSWNAVTTTRRFDYWEYTIGETIYQNDNRTATITGITTDIEIFVKWHEATQNIKASAYPYNEGYVVMRNITKGTTSQSSGTTKADLDWDLDDNVVIDYVITGTGRFNYWDIKNRTFDSSGKPTRHYTSTKYQLPMTDYPYDDYDVQCNLEEKYTIRVARNQPWGTAYILLEDGTKTDEFAFFPNERVTIVATANVGYKFDTWVGGDGVDTSGLDLTQATLTFTAEQKREGTWFAYFLEKPIAIGVRDNLGNNHVYIDVNGKRYLNWLFKYNDDVSIVAEDVPNYNFSHWELSGVTATIDTTSKTLSFKADYSHGGYYTAIYESTSPEPPTPIKIDKNVLYWLISNKKKKHKRIIKKVD